LRGSQLFRLALIGAILAVATSAYAHVSSVSYLDAVIKDRQARLVLHMPMPELDVLFGLDKNHDKVVDAAELQQGAEQLRAYLKEKISLSVPGRVLPATIGDFKIWRDAEGNPYAETELVFASDETLGQFTLSCNLLGEVVELNRTIAKITFDGRSEQFIFEGGQAYEATRRGIAATILQFVRLGIFHIFTGYDHIAFLLGLLVVGGSFINILKIVTSFTVAHSITLALAGLGVVTLPTRLVESGIALSIVYIALENLFVKSFNRRWLVSFFFGLVHGFGFANVLRELDLSRSGLVASLFSFNIGVEIGQVAIVALLLPLLWLVKTKRFYGLIIKSASAVILILGLVWFYQRAFVW
jgi:hypothetical protein